MHHCASLSLGIVDLDLQTTWKFLADKLTCLCLHSSKHLLAGLDVLVETRGSEKRMRKDLYTYTLIQIHIKLGPDRIGSLACKETTPLRS